MKRLVKHQKSSLNLTAIKLEGSLFLPDQLEKSALGQSKYQEPKDYQIPLGIKLKEEYSRAYQIAIANWKHFAAQTERQDLQPGLVTHHFVETLFKQVLGYHNFSLIHGVTLNELHYPISAMAGNLPIIIAPHNQTLDEACETFAIHGAGTKKKSAFQLAQSFLNASENHLWAIVTNGRQLRLLRDADTLTRPSYLEIDLQDLLSAQRFSEFQNAWRLIHASRADLNGECIWEQWRTLGKEEGTRVRNGLREGVTDALLQLGQGFIEHPDNQALREALYHGELSPNDYFQQLLRLIYRFIFLFTVEERDLLQPKTQLKARQIYAQGYAMNRLKARCLNRRALTHHTDLWQGVRIVFRGLADGQQHLALPALGGLFNPNQCRHIDQAQLSNRALLLAMKSLRWFTLNNQLAPVDYRNMGPEELGSVYESLLELVPEIAITEKRFGFVGITSEGSTQGNARKTSGSYYTPDELVQELIKSALEPVIQQKRQQQPDNPQQAILSIRVIDPACGSGHFLLAAARRLAEELAAIRALDGGVTDQDYRHALREVIANCIFGVDKNPMAIELARTALWLEGFEENQPLSFLDHHLQVGDALLGIMHWEQLTQGIPTDAFKALSGDDKAVVKVLAAQNRNGLKAFQKRHQNPQLQLLPEDTTGLKTLQAIEAMPQNTPKQIAKQEAAYHEFLRQAKQGKLAQAADCFVGAFLIAKTAQNQQACPTSATLYCQLYDESLQDQDIQRLQLAQQACQMAGVFHWPLAFPQVFAKGGFDCVIGNPPWEVLKQDEFFVENNLFIEKQQNWFKSPIFEIIKGKKDLYKLFINQSIGLINDLGRLGLVLPLGFMFEDDLKSLRQKLFNELSVTKILHIQNKKKVFFEDVHASYRFILLEVTKEKKLDHSFSEVISTKKDLLNPNLIKVSRSEFDMVIGEDRSALIFDKVSYASIHRDLLFKLLNYEQLSYKVVAEFHSSSDKDILNTCYKPGLKGLVKNATIHFFNAQFGPVEKWVSLQDYKSRLLRKELDVKIWEASHRLVFRDIARSDDTRTLIPCLIPSSLVSTYDAPMIVPENYTGNLNELAFYTGFLSSFIADFLIRPYVDKHIKAYIINKVPIPLFDSDNIYMSKISYNTLNLLEESDLTSKEKLVSEINGCACIISGTSQEDFKIIMKSFSGLMNTDLKNYDEYRTQRLVLEAWDKLESGELI
ncbi:Eco57I restriction-modification methylase domain-containing protein [Thiomicrospira microaerophila]|uniref:Eco57I restriction-modification methylase domain-containing protein n=1 Tax=Thiomicrospira microaerophila TaxID=406020 RepID=UPI0005C9367D|nr:N-6 DNA methylase [Thiomicrospira microaerophila]